MDLKKIVVPLIVVALLVAAAFTWLGGSETKTLTAHFPRTVSVYEGSDVRVLGVPIGHVDTVTPSGTDVVVTMSYDAKVKIPADAAAVIVSPSIVGDRFIQLTPVYTGGDVMKTGATLDADSTGVPLELDQIYQSLDDLTVALGPNGANAKGALTDLLETTAANFGGQGAKFHQTIQDFSELTGTLDDNKEELFGSAQALEGFVRTLARQRPDGAPLQPLPRLGVDHAVGGARRAVAASLRHLAVAMQQVSGFVQGEPRAPRQQHQGPQPRRQGAGEAARRARRDPQRRPGGPEQPGPDLQPAGRHPRHPREPPGCSATRSPATRPPSSAASSTRPTSSGDVCDVIKDVLGKLPAVPRAGTFGRGRRTRARAVRPDPRRTRGGRPMRRLRLLVLALLASLMLGGCGFDVYKLPLPGGTDVGDHPMTVHIMFRDVLDLVPQSTVKVNDVSVGKVTDVSLDGYTADVTVQLQRDVELPDNAEATIRQTSLLGEKFVSLAAPESGASANPLRSGDVIPLERSGRNPEVEEVLGALSLLLNGGGVAQLRTIAKELNLALEGREGTTRSVLDQVQTLMTQLDDHKADIVNAIDKLNDLSVAINKQRSSIDAALEELPSALTSIDKQRKDLVKLLQALAELSDVGVGVIKASKDATIDSLQQLSPVLSQIAASGDDFVNAFNVFLTYPFVDEVVGRDPQVARNLHMGDYTNLSITLDINVDTGITLPTGLPTGLPTLPTDLPTTLPTLVDPTVIIGDVLACLQSGSLTSPECMKVLAPAGEAAQAP